MVIVVNLFGGPGIGKSTLALGLTYELKVRGASVEYVPEFAKDLVYEGRLHQTTQHDIFQNQYRRLKALQTAGVKIAVSDSPLLLSLVYNEDTTTPDFKHDVSCAAAEFDNINISLKRVFKYVEHGRAHCEEEAIAIDNKIEELLEKRREFRFQLNADADNLQFLTTLVLICRR